MVIEKNDSLKLLFLDGLRAIAALYVLIHHCVIHFYGAKLPHNLGKFELIVAFFFQGRLAVDLFIVLSGFCLTLPVFKSGSIRALKPYFFYKKRVIRILPPYFLAILLSIILIDLFIGQKSGTHWDVSIPVTYVDVIYHLLLINDFFHTHVSTINHSFWSISVECRIYLFFPLVIFLMRKFGLLMVLISATFGSGLMYFIMFAIKSVYSDIDIAFPGVNPYLVLFCLGAVAANISFSKKKYTFFESKITLLLSAFGSIILYFFTRHELSNHNAVNGFLISELTDLFFGVSCFFLLIICSKENYGVKSGFVILRKLFSYQPLVFIGTFAYSIYLVHAPLIELISKFVIVPLRLSVNISTFLLTILSLILIIPFSYLFFIVCERPFIKLGKKLSLKQLEVETAISPAI